MLSLCDATVGAMVPKPMTQGNSSLAEQAGFEPPHAKNGERNEINRN